jgi:parallel beta-helix repeat protein
MLAKGTLASVLPALVLVLAAAGIALAGQTYYVATDGSDQWSGRLPAPNAARSDGPFATLVRARDAVRRAKTGPGGLSEAVHVQIRGGTYYLAETITFAPEDSGTEQYPIAYEAFPGEQPILCGGQKITRWQPYRGKIQSVALPDVAAGKWHFRSLFAEGRRQVRARAPNVDAADPYRKGFFYAGRDPAGFGLAVGNIHNPGDWMEYKVQVPADGDYAFWMYYGHHNAPWKLLDMGGHTTLSVDGQTPTVLANLPDTGDWGTLRWSRTAAVRLSKGEHVLRWQNVKGGGLTLVAYALTDDPAWQPSGKSRPAPAAGRHLLVIQAANFTRSQGKQLSVGATATECSATRFHYEPGTFKPAWVQAPEAEIHIFQGGSCRAFKEIVSIVKADQPACTVTIGGKECGAAIQPGDRYFVENVLEELDSPGEWYLDRQRGQLFWWPMADPSEKTTVVAPRLGRLVQFLGDQAAGKPVAHIRLAGLTFQETDYSPDDGCAGYGMGNDGVVYMKDATGCAVADCTFRNIGKFAVCVSAGSGNAIEGNEICEGAEGGVLLLVTARNKVTENHIHHCGAVYKHVGGVILEGPKTDENLVAHNAIHDFARYGISLKNPGSRNRVEYNRVLNTNLETFDTGGIEVTQHDKEFRSESTIRNNVVGDTIGYSCIGPKAVFLSWGIYLDSYAGGYTVTHNVCYRSAHGGLMLQGGKDNRVENNIFVDGALNQMHLSNFDNNSTGQVLRRNIFCYTAPNAVLVSAGRLDEKVIQIDQNVYFHAGGKELLFRGGAASWADWQKRGFDRNSVVADPRFVDPAHDNFALRPDSPALRLGFEPIDTSRVGPLNKKCRCKIRPAAVDFDLAGAGD